MAGHLDQTIFWKLQGTGHWHIATYALLLPSAWITHGDPWLDCVLSWIFLVAYAGILLYWRARTLPISEPAECAIAFLIAFLALYPGNFFNLQMGWQLAVFQCLFGSVVAITALTAPRFGWRLNFMALAAAILGILSFAVSYALFAVAFASMSLRNEIKWRQRIAYLIPWLILALIVYHFGHSARAVLGHFRVWRIVKYTLYYLGSGVARFAPPFAPWVAATALVSLWVILRAIRNQQKAMPWFLLLLFAMFGAALTAVGRGFLEPAQSGALVPRYVSFSVAFWIGWLGLLARARADGARWQMGRWAAVIGSLAIVNATQLTQEARQLGQDSRGTAQMICGQWPNLEKSFLNSLIYSGADTARSYLQSLHDLNFAPFDACAPQGVTHK
jgi:hypothetical protein